MPKKTQFYMSDEEIRKSFREAKDKRDQIKVLADLNVTGTDQIKRKLLELGEITQEQYERSRRGPKGLRRPSASKPREEGQNMTKFISMPEQKQEKKTKELQTPQLDQREREIQKLYSDALIGAIEEISEKEEKKPSEVKAEPKQEENAFTVRDLYKVLEEAMQAGFAHFPVLVEGQRFRDMWVEIKQEIRKNKGITAVAVELHAMQESEHE